MPAEAKARIRINDPLTKSGWRFFADNNEPANVQLEAHVKTEKKTLDLIREDKEALTLDHLLEVSGMGLAKAAQILSGFELARRHLGRGWRKFPAQRT